MPTTKTAPKSATKVSAPVDVPEDEEVETETETETASNGDSATKAKREMKVQYADFDNPLTLEVADEFPEQVHIPRNTSGLVGRSSQYVKLLERIKNEFPGKAVKLASFENGGAASVARNELLGLPVKNRKTGEMVPSKQRELPEGTTTEDWEVEIRRVPTVVDGKNTKVSQLWVRYIGA